jgi:MoaA/NifB/PqqE/SkfB family radical SAM enzyme
MPVVATNTAEKRCSSLGEHRQLLVNIELNNSCAYTKVCGQTCYLNLVSPVGKTPLRAEQVFAAAREFILHGEFVRHLVLPGKEVFESPEVLLRVIEEFHAVPIHSRPGQISIITASPFGLKRYARRLADTPLGVLNISMDTTGSGLRSLCNNEPLFEAALRLKEIGGTEAIGVNTVLTKDNLADAVQIGKRLQGSGIDQWTLGPLLHPVGGRMESVLPVERLREIVDHLCHEFAGEGLNIVVDLDLPLLAGFTKDPEVFSVGAGRWRYEYELPGAPNILLEAGNPRPGHFVRMDWAGQLMSKEDFRCIGRPGSYGNYAPGRIMHLLKEFQELRSEPVAV